MTRPSHLLDSLVTIRTKLDVIEPLVQEAYEIVYSTRRIGSEKVTGGFTPDTTGERASCDCEATFDDAGNQLPIVHVCSSARYHNAAKALGIARVSIVQAANDLQSIVRGSQPKKEQPFEHRDRAKIAPEDHNPAAARALHDKARRIATEMAETFRKRLVGSGMDRQAAAAMADRMRRSA